MINNEELPIGFTMELAQHSDVLNHFSHLSKQEQESVIEGARSIKSHNEMRNYVESLLQVVYSSDIRHLNCKQHSSEISAKLGAV